MQIIKSFTKLLFFICPVLATAQSTYTSQGAKIAGVMQLDMTNFKGSADLDIVMMKDYTNEEQNKLPSLTKREKEDLLKISEGFTNLQISELLFISIDTVDSHRKNLHTKLNVKNTAMLIKFAIENNML